MIDVVDKERQGLDPKLKDVLDREQLSDKDYIFCGICSNVLGRKADRIDVHGKHEHYCVNPHGIEFRVGCFSEALGCTISGPPMAADTWFAGHRWRLASCSQCKIHLGWYFDTADQYFYGLILDKIQFE